MMGSDHTPIVCRVDDILQTQSETTKWKLNKADWHQYCEHILSILIPGMVNAAANTSIPIRKAGQRGK